MQKFQWQMYTGKYHSEINGKIGIFYGYVTYYLICMTPINFLFFWKRCPGDVAINNNP